MGSMSVGCRRIRVKCLVRILAGGRATTGRWVGRRRVGMKTCTTEEREQVLMMQEMVFSLTKEDEAVLRQMAREMTNENRALKWWADHEPLPAEEAALRYLKEMCVEAKCSPADLEAARSRIYLDGWCGPLRDDDWEVQDGRLGPHSRARAVEIIDAALEVGFDDVEFYNPEGESVGLACPECGHAAEPVEEEGDGESECGFECSRCEWAGEREEAFEAPNCKLDGSDVRHEYWKFLDEIYGDLRVF